MSRLDGLHRFGVTILLHAGSEPDPGACIPVFHRWIRERALDRLLIDVADYTHLPDGPQVLLVGHEGNIALHRTNGRLGLECTRKRPAALPFAGRLEEAARVALCAARLLEHDATLDPLPRFAAGSLEFVANDRLVAPPDDATFALLRSELAALLQTLYPGAEHDLRTQSSPGERLRVQLTSSETPSLETLVSRIS